MFEFADRTHALNDATSLSQTHAHKCIISWRDSLSSSYTALRSVDQSKNSSVKVHGWLGSLTTDLNLFLNRFWNRDLHVPLEMFHPCNCLDGLSTFSIDWY